LAERLAARGFAVEALNGDIVQVQRERTVARLKSGQIDIVVATDVAARGLDVERVSHVVNYDVPYDPESYVHRIGRTGRAGRSGEAILFIAPRERNMLRVIERATRQQIEAMQLPTIEDVNERRVARFNEKLTTAIESGAGQMFLPLIENYERENNVSAADIAAALASIAQGATPLLMESSGGSTSPYGSADQTFERGEERSTRGKRGSDKPARSERFERPERQTFDRDVRPGRKRDDSISATAEEKTESSRGWPRPPAQAEAAAPTAESKPLNRRERRALEHAQRESGGSVEGHQHDMGVHKGSQKSVGARKDVAVQESAPESMGVQESDRLPDRRKKIEARDTPRRERARSDRGGEPRNDAAAPEPRPRAGGDEDVETYRIEVGHDHGVKPNNIVGAIANEVGLDGRLIGRVVIREDHSFVDLPAGMPKEVFRQLQKVRVAGQPLQISRALKTHVEKLRRERPPTAKFKGKPQSGAQRGRKK
jgi:ATP-dependent RNA helicase DeaD